MTDTSSSAINVQSSTGIAEVEHFLDCNIVTVTVTNLLQDSLQFYRDKTLCIYSIWITTEEFFIVKVCMNLILHITL